jgi:uncharacterized membrane protein
MTILLAQEAEATTPPMISDPAGLVAVLLGGLALIFWFGETAPGRRFFRVVPALVFCYFVPMLLTTFGVIPESSVLYSWVKAVILPAAILLLVLSLDLPGIMRLGPRAVIMMLAGTAGVVVGGPLALMLCRAFLPESALPDDAWQGLSALAGSWIGGGANFVAIGEIAGASDTQMATMVIPDVFVGAIWMGALLFLSGYQHRIDRWTGADASAIRDLEQRMTEFQESVSRIPHLPDLIMILALGFAGSWACSEIAKELPVLGSAVGTTTWKFVLVTTLGIVLSFTPARRLEGAGASRLGSVMIYLLVACIGASADLRRIAEHPAYFLVGIIWMSFHVVVMLTVARLVRAPIFFMAVGSQANIGGAASAPVVAAAYHPSLAPVGVLLAVAGYVLGTYAGILCMHLLKAASGA